jgi:hypothetical protein
MKSSSMYFELSCLSISNLPFGKYLYIKPMLTSAFFAFQVHLNLINLLKYVNSSATFKNFIRYRFKCISS